MVKNKFFLYGLGAGLIIASVILQLTNIFALDKNQSESSPSGTIDWNQLFSDRIAELNTKAQEHGYRIVLEHADYYTPEQMEQIRTEILESVEDRTVRALMITPGMGRSAVSKQLLALDLIADEASFLQELEKREMFIQPGVFTFEGNPTLVDIVDKITTPHP